MRTQLDPAPPAWTVITVAPDPEVRTGAGHLVAAQPLDAAAGADLLVVPALSKREPGELIAQVGSAELDPVRKAVVAARDRGTPVYSACTGSFLLAESGILDGRRATTSWWLSPVFRARYPAVELDQTKMLVADDGVTTAGAAFGHLDLALAIVRLASPALADLVASYLVIDERPSQSAYTITSALAHSDPTLAAFERWARDRLADPITIAEAARALGLSERTLQRTVQRTLGISPLRFVQDLRVEQASHLIKTTALPLEAIARRVGYEHATTLRTLLRERTGHTTRTLRRA
jgi:transcriptional regulator GlxA family with amidase domain